MKTPFASAILLAGLGMTFSVRAASTTPVNPAGVGDYSYIQVERVQAGNSGYFGDSAKGNGIAASWQFGQNVFVYGNYDRLGFDQGGYLYHSGIGFGYAQDSGKVSAYLRGGYYRDTLSNGARSYYWQFGYGLRGALNKWFGLQGELYTDLHPEFASVPWGLKVGVNFALGPVSLGVMADHNPDVNTLSAALRVAF